MESLLRMRDAMIQAAAKAVGLDALQPVPVTQAQQRAVRQVGQILSLPVADYNWTPLQDMDPASPTFGQPLFMVGVDGIGSAPLG